MWRRRPAGLEQKVRWEVEWAKIREVAKARGTAGGWRLLVLGTQRKERLMYTGGKTQKAPSMTLRALWMVFVTILLLLVMTCKNGTKNLQISPPRFPDVYVLVHLLSICVYICMNFFLNCLKLSCRNDAPGPKILQCTFLKTRNSLSKPQYSH